MRPIDERALRASFINATRKEVSDISLPPGFDEIDFDKLDYLGWTDPKLPRRSYVVVWIDDVVTGVVLQRAEQRVLARAQCSWCEDVTLRNDVQLYTARKAGPAGRKGDTIEPDVRRVRLLEERARAAAARVPGVRPRARARDADPEAPGPRAGVRQRGRRLSEA